MIYILFFENFNKINFLVKNEHNLIFATSTSRDLVTFKDLAWEK